MKKLNKGMTLVEVVIAMAVFSTMTLAITMAFAAAVKYNARNIRRDYELSLQQTAVQKSTAAGVEIYEDSFEDRKLVYREYNQTMGTYGSEVLSIDNVSEYNAIKSAQNGSDFNFEIKTFSSTTLGATACQTDKSQDTYKISCVNQSSKTVDVRITTSMGIIYEGDLATGYIHPSNLYRRSVLGIGQPLIKTGEDDAGNDITTSPSGFEIGYKNSALSTEASSINVKIYTFSPTGDEVLNYNHNINNYSILSSTNGEVKITIAADGSCSVSYN